MQCPKDHKNLLNRTFKGVTIHECESCDGKWFDHDELKSAIAATDNDLRWLDFDLFTEHPEKYKTVESNKACPKDNNALTSLHYMDSSVVIEKCRTCNGVWLDKTEFEKIITYLKKRVVNESSSDYAKATIKEFEEIFTGPESKSSEIKDFLAVTKLFQLRLEAEHPWVATISNDIYKFWPVK